MTGIPAPGEPIVLETVSVFYGEVVGLSHVGLSLGTGITGLVGPNGSGKTTLMRVLTGLVRPGEGTARVLGGDPFSQASIRSRISFVPAGESFYEGLSARRNLEVAFLAKGRTLGEARELAAAALASVRLEEHADRPFGVLSRGMRQRLKIGLALTGNSELVLLDEPFLGVDPPNRAHLREDILRLGSEKRIVLVSSHVLHEVEGLTDRVGILAHGRLLGLGKIADLLRDLRDRHPHRVQLQTQRPRRLGALLLECTHVRELRMLGEDGLEFMTDRPDEAYRELAALVVASGAPVRQLETTDDGLEAVFRHMTAGGTRRL